MSPCSIWSKVSKEDRYTVFSLLGVFFNKMVSNTNYIEQYFVWKQRQGKIFRTDFRKNMEIKINGLQPDLTSGEKVIS